MKRNAIFILAITIIIICSGTFKINSYDAWWHLTYGKVIYSKGDIPTQDQFSFSAEGTPRINPEWLFQLVSYIFYLFSGISGLIMFKVLVILLSVLIVTKYLLDQESIPKPLAFLVLLPFLLAGQERYLVRPEIITLCFTLLMIYGLFRPSFDLHKINKSWWFPLLFALWANFHAGFIVGIVILGLFIIGRTLDTLRREKRLPEKFSTNLIIYGICILFTLINPWIYKIWKVPFSLTSLHQTGVFRNAEWVTPTLKYHWLFYITLLITLLILIWLFRSLSLAPLLPLIFLGIISVLYVRNIALFSIAAPLLLAVQIKQAKWEDHKLPKFNPFLVLGIYILIGFSVMLGSRSFKFGLGINLDRVPYKAVRFLNSMNISGNILNAHPFGGYLIWRWYPQKKIFIDGRDDIYASLWKRLNRAVKNHAEWSQLINEFKISHTLLRYTNQMEKVILPDGKITWRPFGVNHFPPDQWALIYWDDLSMVHLRRSPTHQRVIDQYEYKHIFPETVQFQLEALKSGLADPKEAVKELRRKLQEDPKCQRAFTLLSHITQSHAPHQ